MEVMVPVPDFHFDSTVTSPYVSAPSSPKPFGDPFDYYTSAPTTPSPGNNNISCNTRRLLPTASSPAITFNWEEKPNTPRVREHDFEFEFSGPLAKGGLPPELTTADELFDKGKIRPLKPPPRLHPPSPRTPISPGPRGLWSPRRRGGGGGGEGLDPFTAAMVEVTRERRRERNPLSNSFSRSRKGSRSLSPLRGTEVGVFHQSPNSSSLTASTKSGGSKKWRLRDLFLFRSASEGRATGTMSKDPLHKYTLLSPSSSSLLAGNKRGDDSRNSSFRSTDSHGSMRRRGGAVASAHEMLYTAKRAASEEEKKKTPLPYRQGLFGCLPFNPAVNSITRGFTSYSFNRRSS